ncbi:MAG: hypothetical protein AB7J40_05575 [Candidatus Altimarinota bacterium]
MNPTSTTISVQIQRLMLRDADKQRLLEELKNADQAKLEMFAGLIREHDQEALKVLNEKAKEQEGVRQNFMETSGAPSDQLTEAEGQQVLELLENTFKNPDQLAEFIAQSDDAFLMELEEVLVNSLEGKPQYQEEFRRFFQEARLQKAAVEKAVEDDQKQALIDAILQTEEQTKQLDRLIAEAEKALNMRNS